MARQPYNGAYRQDNYVAPRPVFTRVIVTADRECSQCEDVIEDGSIAFKDKRLDLYCSECVDYEMNRSTEQRRTR